MANRRNNFGARTKVPIEQVGNTRLSLKQYQDLIALGVNGNRCKNWGAKQAQREIDRRLARVEARERKQREKISDAETGHVRYFAPEGRFVVQCAYCDVGRASQCMQRERAKALEALRAQAWSDELDGRWRCPTCHKQETAKAATDQT